MKRVSDYIFDHLAETGTKHVFVITGGGAMFGGLDEYLHEETKLPVRVADDPRYAIVRGLERMFDTPLLLRRVMRQEPSLDLDLQSETI